jgi:hypothetical protein
LESQNEGKFPRARIFAVGDCEAPVYYYYILARSLRQSPTVREQDNREKEAALRADGASQPPGDDRNRVITVATHGDPAPGRQVESHLCEGHP